MNMIAFPLFVFTSFQTSLSISNMYKPKVMKNYLTESNVNPLRKLTKFKKEFNISNYK